MQLRKKDAAKNHLAEGTNLIWKGGLPLGMTSVLRSGALKPAEGSWRRIRRPWLEHREQQGM